MLTKVKMVIRGNLKCKKYYRGGGKSNLVIYADENEYDTSEAITLDGDVCADSVVCDGLIIITGDISICKEV